MQQPLHSSDDVLAGRAISRDVFFTPAEASVVGCECSVRGLASVVACWVGVVGDDQDAEVKVRGVGEEVVSVCCVARQ